MSDLLPQTSKYITLDYKFFNKEDNILLGSSDESGPYTFLCGSGDAIPGLEEHVIALQENDSKSFVIPAEKAYGIYNPDVVKTIARTAFPESLELTEGLQISINNTPVTVVELKDDSVVVDGNHPLAGVDLQFSVVVRSISDTAPQGQGGCCGGGGNSDGCGCDH